MKRTHWPIRVLAIMGLFVALALGGGPIAFVLLVMLGPLILIMIFSARAVVHGSGGVSHTAYPHDDRLGPDKL